MVESGAYYAIQIALSEISAHSYVSVARRFVYETTVLRIDVADWHCAHGPLGDEWQSGSDPE
jgi:hypothetical protein